MYHADLFGPCCEEPGPEDAEDEAVCARRVGGRRGGRAARATGRGASAVLVPGGRSFLLRDARGLEETLATVARELRYQYLLDYEPFDPIESENPSWRLIRVVLQKPGLRVRVSSARQFLARIRRFLRNAAFSAVLAAPAHRWRNMFDRSLRARRLREKRRSKTLGRTGGGEWSARNISR